MIERIEVSYQHIVSNFLPLYCDMETDEHDRWHRPDSINAVWHSITLSYSSDRSDKGEYRTLCHAARSVRSASTESWILHNLQWSLGPIKLAKGLLTVNIRLGIVFSDDPSVVVWLLGKASNNTERELIVYCNPTSRTRFAGYTAMKLLNSETAPALCADRLHALESTGGSRRVGEFDSTLLISRCSIARQSWAGWKPLPFLRFPGELGKKVYDDYLSYCSPPHN